MSDFNLPENVKCPACKLHSKADSLNSEGLVVAAAKAVWTADDVGVLDCMNASTPYDFHVSVGMLLDVTRAVAGLTGISVLKILDNTRDAINAEQGEM
jgi:hypothetical protein